jgi:hypothetical protein
MNYQVDRNDRALTDIRSLLQNVYDITKECAEQTHVQGNKLKLIKSDVAKVDENVEKATEELNIKVERDG